MTAADPPVKDSRVHVSEVGSKLGADGFTLTAAGRLDS